jgi:hypothetical protein
MTTAQWLFEYQTLKDAEKERYDMITLLFRSGIKAFRETLISTLGLNPTNEPPDEDDGTPFVPLSLMVGRPEIMHELLQEADRNSVPQAKDHDEQYEAIAQKLASGDFADLHPIFTDASFGKPTPNSQRVTPEEKWRRPENLEFLRSLGVTLINTDDEDGAQEAHESVDG